MHVGISLDSLHFGLNYIVTFEQCKALFKAAIKNIMCALKLCVSVETIPLDRNGMNLLK